MGDNLSSAMETEEEKRREQRLHYRRMRPEMMRCIYCTQVTVLISSVVGLPFCCKEHHDKYWEGYLSSWLYDCESKMRNYRHSLNLIEHYSNAENQEGIFEADRELRELIDSLEEDRTEAALGMANYNAFKQEIESQREKAPDLMHRALIVVNRILHYLEFCLHNIEETLADARVQLALSPLEQIL